MVDAAPPMFRLSFRRLYDMFEPDVPDVVRAERLGISRSTLTRACQRDSSYAPAHAEQLAVRAGWLPGEVWGLAWEWADEMCYWWDAEGRREWRRHQWRVDARRKRREARAAAKLRAGEKFWGWADSYSVPPHTCAVDGCRCGRENTTARALNDAEMDSSQNHQMGGGRYGE